MPVPDLIGRPAAGYPWPFFGAHALSGREAAGVALDDARRTAVGLELAAFLRRLHAVELAVRLPLDPNRRADMARRIALTREQLAEGERLGLWRAPARSLAC